MEHGAGLETSSHPQRLLRRLDDLASVLAARKDALALLALGSAGRDLDRLDDHSDLDFFVVVEETAKRRYLEQIDWLEAVGTIVYSFANTVDGRKALFEDGVFAEYAIFTPDELRTASHPPPRLVWQRSNAELDLALSGRVPARSPLETPEFQVDEALTNVFVGLHRDARGEHLAAGRLIQVHAVDRLLDYLDLTGFPARPRQDLFAVERGAEARIPAEVLPLARFVPGYERNREAALAILDWLETHADPSPVLAAAIRRLAAT